MSLATRGLAVNGRIEDVSVDLRPGTITAICGPNGAGKSTLLACLAGLLAPDQGHVLVDGQPLDALGHQARARIIGYLPQSPEVAWDIAVEVLVSLGRLPWRDAPADEARAAIREAIETMDLEALLARPVSRLSGGERARALMARVLAIRPQWLLADEPLANLDLAHAAALLGRFREQADRGRGVVLVLHDLAMAMNHADRVLVLEQGRVFADGPPAQALSAPNVAQVWRCTARWLGEAGEMALSVGR